MSGKSEYEEEVEQVADKVQNTTGFSPPLTEHLVFVGQYISWYTKKDGNPDKQDFKSFNEDVTELIDEASKEDVDLGDIALVLWAHLCNIEQMHRKDDKEEDESSGSSTNQTADRMFQ